MSTHSLPAPFAGGPATRGLEWVLSKSSRAIACGCRLPRDPPCHDTFSILWEGS